MVLGFTCHLHTLIFGTTSTEFLNIFFIRTNLRDEPTVTSAILADVCRIDAVL